MKFRSVAFTAALLATQFAFAGASNAVLTCKSASGRTTVNANFPVDMTEAAMSISVDGKTQTYINADMVDILRLNNRDANVEYPGHKVVSIGADKNPSSITMTAVDTGEKFDTVYAYLSSVGSLKRKSQAYGEVIRFRANLRGMDPRDDQAELPVITVECVYDYSI